MKKNILLIWTLIAMFGFFANYSVVSASVGVDIVSTTGKNTDLFDVVVHEVKKIEGANTSRLDFKTRYVDGISFGHWEVRVWCDDNAKIGFGELSANSCNNTVVVNSTEQMENFSIFVTKLNKNRSKFLLKFKAFDTNGKWLYSEKRPFNW